MGELIFSDIVQRFDTGLNALYRERDACLARGEKIIDLVSGNVNRAGFVFPEAILKQALAQGIRQSKIYAPDPQGQKSAREAVRSYYRSQDLEIPADQIVLTPGTSVSYWYLFKLLANPGDEILTPAPCYPLLESIAELCHIKLTGYRLREKERWTIDFADLTAAITPRTRAIVLISPHNPTGAVASDAEIAELVKISTEKNLPIISDEVFSEFIFDEKPLPRPARNAERGMRNKEVLDEKHPHSELRIPNSALVFTLNGVSKMFALPNMKIGWIGITGPSETVKTARQALDHISDTFLPVNEIAQFALPTIFSQGKVFLAAFKQDLIRRQTAVSRGLAAIPGISLIPPEGGFYLTVRLDKANANEEEIALDLLRKERLLVHPGYFYDLEGQHLVMSFVSSSKEAAGSMRRLAGYLSQL